MKIFICCSKYHYHRIPKIKIELEKVGHEITLPNSYEEPFKEERIKKESLEYYVKWKRSMIKLQEKKIRLNDALLILNFDKNSQLNYIGGATFLEIYEAWRLNKKIFLYNPIPKSILEDEIIGFNPIIINKDLSKIIKNAMD